MNAPQARLHPRWMFHVAPAGAPLGDAYAPPSLATEGFVHASYRDAVATSARLHHAGQDVEVLRIDPLRLDVPWHDAATPRGPMPHVHGPIPRDAVAEVLPLADVARAPDRRDGARIAFVAFEGMTLLDLVGVLDPISRIASMGFDPTLACDVVSARGRVAWSLGGARFEVDRERPPLDEYDAVVVAGGLSTRALVHDRDVAAWLAAFPSNRLTTSVCTGALLLGAAGKLRGRRATTIASALDLLAAHGAHAVRERVVDEGQIVTAGGVTSGLDLGLHLVARLAGDETAAAIARQMEMRALVSGAAGQRP